MPIINLSDVLLAELNKRNGQTVQVSDTDFQLLPMGPGQTVFRRRSVPVSTIGFVKVMYNLIDLSTVQASVNSKLTLLPAPTMGELLDRISQQIGLRFTTKDIADYPIDTATQELVLTALAGSPTYMGELSFQATWTSATLASQVPVLAVPGLHTLTTWNDLTALLANVNNAVIPAQSLTYGTPSAVTGDNGTNTAVTATGLEQYGYTGSVVVNYQRRDLSQLSSQNVLTQAVYSGTVYGFLQQFLPTIAAMFTAEDIVNSPLTVNSSGTTAIAVNAVENSRNVIGSLQVFNTIVNPNDAATVTSASLGVLYQVREDVVVPSVSLSVLYPA